MHFYLTTNSNLIRTRNWFLRQPQPPHHTTRYTTRKKIQDALMWIDFDDKISKPMIHSIEDKEGNPSGQQRIVIPGFDFYSKEVGAGSG